MTTLILIFVSLLGGADDDVYAVTVSFKAMHCNLCEEQLVAYLKKVDGVKADTIKVNGAAVSLAIGEKTGLPYAKLKSSCPRDMSLVAIVVEIRGEVSESSGAFKLKCKVSSYLFTLKNPEKPREDRLGALKKEMGDKNRFLITGTATAADTLVLETFSKAEWK